MFIYVKHKQGTKIIKYQKKNTAINLKHKSGIIKFSK